jgi:hypothetical protein
VNGSCKGNDGDNHHPVMPIIIKNVFRNTIINNILVLLQQVPVTTQNDIELVNCTNALIHHNNSMLPQCDIDIRNDYIGQNYGSNIAYQLAADYLQVRGGTSLGTSITATTTTPSGSGGSTNTSSGVGTTTTKTTIGNTVDRNTLQQIPSKPTDFPGNDANAIQIHVTSAKKDIIGDYHVKGEITNIGKSILNFVKVTVHFYDAKGQLIADSSCCYTDPTNIDPGHTSTFDSFVMASEISGSKPVSYRLSFDWS